MVKLTQARTVHTHLELTNEEARQVVVAYLTDVVIGRGCYITEDGRLEHWTKFPHGSGTTTDKGEPTNLQRAAGALLVALAG